MPVEKFLDDAELLGFENLEYFELKEMYEECVKINTAIKSLIKTK